MIFVTDVVFPMYMGVILGFEFLPLVKLCIPHVYGGDPNALIFTNFCFKVFPMYMGVILIYNIQNSDQAGIPHVYGGDPNCHFLCSVGGTYSPCIWG